VQVKGNNHLKQCKIIQPFKRRMHCIVVWLDSAKVYMQKANPKESSFASTDGKIDSVISRYYYTKSRRQYFYTTVKIFQKILLIR
jgi:hypothetical protein